MNGSGIITLNHKDRIAGNVKGFNAVRLFPYDIQDIGNFLNQEHPRWDGTPKNKSYWQDETRRCLEGHWVKDGQFYVYMMPKLYMYINHGTIVLSEQDEELGTDRVVGRPKCTHLEWIFQTALLCCMGFSGFRDDPNITCNKYIRDLHLGKKVSKKHRKIALKYGKKKNGDLKQYVDPWEYLTRFYLCDEPTKKPLGMPLYSNPVENLVAITSRGTHKTFNMAADFVHEYMTNGAKSFEQYQKSRKIQLFTGAADSNYLESFYEVAYEYYRGMEGTSEVPPHPMYMETKPTGAWSSDKDQIVQKYLQEGLNEWQGSMSTVSKGIFKGDSSNFASVSKRNNRAYVDEFGRVKKARQVYGTFVNALKDGGRKFGVGCFTGTGGNVEITEDAEYMMYHPSTFKALGMPNYWKGTARDIGLFVSYADTLWDYIDDDGNCDILGATQEAIKEREEFETKDNSLKGQETLIDWIINQPLDPTEPFKISQVNIFDQTRIADRIAVLEEGLWNEVAKVKRLKFVKQDEGGQVVVEDRPDLMKNVITRGTDQKNRGNVGEVVFFEPPIAEEVSKPLRSIGSTYKAVMDPTSEKSSGPSDTVIKVYKGMSAGFSRKEMRETVVATFRGRRVDPDKENEIALCLCILYNCMLHYEDNQSAGIYAYFDRYGYSHHLLNSPVSLIHKVSPYSKAKESPGTTMTKTLIHHSTRWLNAEMNQNVFRDLDGKPFTRIDLLCDLAFLYDMLFYGEGNFDDISAMRLLAIWLKHEENVLTKHGHQEDLEEHLQDEFEELADASLIPLLNS